VFSGLLIATSRHHPTGGSVPHCDNSRLEAAIAKHQVQGDAGSLAEIIKLAEPRMLTLIRFSGTSKYSSESELLSDVHHKLICAIPRFDPSRGSAFSFLSCLIQNTLHTSVTRVRRNAARLVELDETIANNLVTNGEIRTKDVLEDLTYRIRAGVRSTITDSIEQNVQRWYVESFLDGAFAPRRHQCCDAAMGVFGVGHERSRELYDLSMLECRRILYDDLSPRRPTIAAGQLIGTRAGWMARYAHLLDAVEFTKFFSLTKDLGPFVIMLVAPTSRSRRQDRNPEIVRENLVWILNGHPSAVPLSQ
jgi:hypothetical protein